MYKPKTVKVVVKGHPRGYKIINESDLVDGDKIFVEPSEAAKAAEAAKGDNAKTRASAKK
jgi:hypothetical protein